MKAKSIKRISLVSIAIIVAITLALVLALLLPSAQPTAQALAGTLYTAAYNGDNGTVERHLTTNERDIIASRYGVGSGDVVAIDRGDNLYKFLAGELYTGYKVAYLVSDVGIAYNATRDGYYNVGVSSSNAIFDRILDGNGYTVKVYGGTGTANSTTPTADDADYRFTRRHGATAYGYAAKYTFTGYLVAQNYGTIANLTVDYTAPHNGIAGNAAETLNSASGDRLQFGSAEGIFSAGIVTGLNGYGGVIDNVKVNVGSAFTVVKATGDEGRFAYNTTYAGGIAGRVEDESTIINCQVDIGANAGIYASSQGKKGSFGGLDEMYCMAIAGGIVGNIDFGTGKIHYSAVTGSGQVKSLANYASTDARYMSFAGGAAGGCIYFYGRDGVQDSNDGISVKEGQIKGIISGWTGSRFANLRKSSQTSMGTLFDSVGSDDVIESVALLYDLETLMDNYPSSTKIMSSDGNGRVALDSRGNFRNWVAIYPTSDGGSMSVEFDTEHPLYDIRMHIVANGHEDFVNSGAMDRVEFNTAGKRYEQFKLTRGQGGGIIWSGIFTSANDSSNHINMNLDDPIYAEVYMISSTNSGNYNYEFGTMGTLAYDKTTDPNDPNLNYVRAYAGSSNPLQLPNVVMTNNLAFDTSVFKNENLWMISRGTATNVALSQTYMPGTYKMNVETVLGERVYGYYNEEQRMLAWQLESDYVFTILQGNLTYGDGTTSTDGWQRSVTFELKMNNVGDFDSLEFQRNGVFPDDSASGFDYRTKPGSAFYEVTAGTGKNGTAYTFYAYKRDTISGEDVLVAVSESRTVRIDTDKPEISEVAYYMVEDGVERLLTEDEVDDLRASVGNNWTKNQILAKFSVTDNDKSGIASAATANYIHDTILNDNGARDVVVEINDSLDKELVYVDARGNDNRVNLQLNVDPTPGVLAFTGDIYKKEGRFNYSTSNVLVYYRAYFGMSGWRMYYSYQRDAQGEDIWVACPDLLANSGAVKTFTIDWNMGNVNTGIGDAFKIKMVNEVGLYDEVYPTTTPYDDNVINNYIIWLRIADIYLDNSLNNVYVEGENKSVADILLDEDEKAKYFDKEYDGTASYDGKKQYKFYTDLSALAKAGFYGDDKAGVIYSPAGMSRPTINVGTNGIVPVELVYKQAEVGDTQLYFQVELQGVDGYNYIVYFTDLANIDFEQDVEVEEGTYSATCAIDVKITKRIVEINLDEQDAFTKVYYYGDDVPTQIESYVAETDEYITIQITTNASSTAIVGEYLVEGTAPDGYDNIEYVVNSTNLMIEQRHVAVDLKYDNGAVGNIPTGENAGKTHKITGTYVDVNGDTKDAIIKYNLKGEVVATLGAVGLYTIEVSLADSNYVIDGQTSFKFNIAKGYLEITTGLQVKDYTEREIEYDLVIDEASKELYSRDDIIVTYYEYLEGAIYNQSTGIIDGKISTEKMTSLPKERGYYFVQVEFIPTSTKGQENFFQKTDYAEGYLVITSASTQVNVEKVVLEYYFTADMYTFNLVDAITEVRSSSNKQLWSASLSPTDVMKVQYKDATGSFVDVAATPNDGGGWYSETGRYEYKIRFLGNDDYKESSIDVVMVINKAELKGITISSVDAVYDGENHLPTAGGLLSYSGLKITFRSGATSVQCDGTTASDALKQFDFKQARTYTLTMTVDKDGYETVVLTSTINVNKAKMEGVSASVIDTEYDGERHTVEFIGLTKSSNGQYTYNGESVIIVSGNVEGVMYATNVYVEEGVGPSYYTGQVTLRSPNYEDCIVNTQITIRQAKLPYQEIGKDLPSKLPSAMNLTEYKGYFVDSDGVRVVCELQYRDKDDNIVTLDENGTLADGRYKVMLVVPSDNYYIDRYWEFDIGEINDPSISTIGYVAIGVVGALLIGAVITAIVVVKKRKKAGIV